MPTTLRRPRSPQLLVTSIGLLALLGAPRSSEAAILSGFSSTGREAIGPGVFHDQGGLRTTGGGQAVHIVEVDLGAGPVTLEAALSNDLAIGLERVSSIARRANREAHRVIAAINGDIWTVSSATGAQAPRGVHVQDGELMVDGSASSPAFALLSDGRAQAGLVAVNTMVTFPDGEVFSVTRINQLRGTNDLVLYTPRFGPSTATNASGTEVVLTGATLPLRTTMTTTATIAEVRPGIGDTPIAPGTLVLSGGGYWEPYLAGLPVGTTVTIQTAITTGWENATQIVSGRETLVRAGAVSIVPYPSTANEQHPRTAVGVTASGDVVLVTVDGRQSDYSTGMTLPDLAQLMLSRGAVDAINLDGGGSTTMAVRLPGDSDVTVVNSPSDGRERAVANALLVVGTAPTGPLALADVRPAEATLFTGGTATFAVRGMDTNFNPVAIDPASVAWTVEGGIGTVDASGRFVASTAGSGAVRATIGGVTDTALVTVLADRTPPAVGAPLARYSPGGLLGATYAPLTVGWSAVDRDSGVAGYELEQRVADGPWQPVRLASPTATSAVVLVRPFLATQFRVRASDRVGNVSAWVAGPLLRPVVYPETVRTASYDAAWRTSFSAGYAGGTAKYASRTGATMRYRFTGTALAWLAMRGPTRGAATVWVDGRYAGTVDLYAPSRSFRRIVFTRAWPEPGYHTFEIRVRGTPGRPTVDVDGILIATAPPVTSSPPPPPSIGTTTATLVGAGDIASCGLTADTATATLVASIPGTVFTAGDNAYESGTPSEFQNCYHPTWGRVKDRTRPSPGNHDYVTAGAAGYFGYFGTAAGQAGQGWYAYDAGTWRVYALNSNCAEIGGCGPGSAQEQWLRADLAANPRQCVAAYWHHPVFSSGAHGGSSEMAAIYAALYEAGAEVVVTGHDHDYERFAPQRPDGTADAARGIRQFVVGTGGASLRAFRTVAPNSEVRNSSTHGVLKLTLGSTGYAWEFVPVAGKTFRDAGSGACH
ncbi:MAG TPA: phosphodiester glycosidase family protein [Candidatus Limnocylindrales bacterium]|nr:phosphodiester glycosidase family protein [Candidatus Limnocylindrales bacterium]